ncbi:hypothetical protein QBC40DRAFT_237676 [Triangularia verruculosa]|uniref:MYND-type domain-containing protein n=1 Tax=Triangularia verruculosa TaxID=2587418 RepID=A0AAN6X6B2_9PEZI|nr:hypothetical protein QBC40DRAFT_237676 [Triangularia verruculosa]
MKGFELPPRCCPICEAVAGLRLCGGCKVVNYCGADHQLSHRPEHKTACNEIKKTREELEREEALLRAKPDDMFNNGVGHFWGITDTRDYMRARHAAADALLQVDTRAAVEKALEHFLDMLRLCRSDNLGVRDIIPGLFLRLGREQECYDFLKWWATADPDGTYNWGDTTLPHLDIHGADVFEPIDMFSEDTSLCHLSMLTLLKLRLYLDMDHWQTAIENGNREPYRPVGKLVRNKVHAIDLQTMSTLVERLRTQYRALIRRVHTANPHFWNALVDSDDEPAMPTMFGLRTPEEACVALYHCIDAWQESEDAMIMIDTDTSEFVPVYETPNNTRGPAAESQQATHPRILTLCFEWEDMLNDLRSDLLSQFKSKATMETATTPKAALQMLNQEPPPSIIFVADGGLARQKKVWERVIDRLRGGATVIVAGLFSNFVNQGEFDRFFARVGLPWRRGSYHRETVTLRQQAVGDAQLARRLPSSYSQKALFVDHVASSDAWYTETPTSREAAVAFTKVGLGKLGYVGDVNGEEGSRTVVLAMCGLL